MPKRKSTIRKLTPLARRLAKLTNELASSLRRLENLIYLVQSAEMEARAAARAANTEVKGAE